MTEWLTQAISSLIEALAMPSVGLPAVFAWCTLSATLLPLGSEAIVFGYIKLNPQMMVWGILVATAGNTLGGMINYWLALGAQQVLTQDKHTQHTPRALLWFEKMGPKALFFSFLPGIGDPLTAVAGWLKMPWLPCLCWQALGKLLRYIVVTALLLYVPDAWWSSLFSPLKSWFSM